MTIEKGQAWGEAGPLPGDGVVARSDAEVRRLVERAHAHHEPFPVIGLTSGDLYRTLGGAGGGPERLRSEEAVTFRVDVGEVLLDGRLHLFVAHLVAHSRLWGRAYVAMNAQWRGDWDLGPKSHPGDGLLDISDARLPLPERLKVRARLASGSHLPHPGIRARRVRADQVEFARPLPVELDGERVGTARKLSVRVQPDALTVVV